MLKSIVKSLSLISFGIIATLAVMTFAPGSHKQPLAGMICGSVDMDAVIVSDSNRTVCIDLSDGISSISVAESIVVELLQ